VSEGIVGSRLLADPLKMRSGISLSTNDNTIAHDHTIAVSSVIGHKD